MWNALKGVTLAVANGIVLAVGLAFVMTPPYRTRDAMDFVGSIAVLAMFSSVPLGALIGLLAGRLRENRLVVLELVTLALVPLCGIATMHMLGVHMTGSEFSGLVLVASSPTVFAVLALERWTRPKPLPPRALQLCVQ
jgi:hypothetical protein